MSVIHLRAVSFHYDQPFNEVFRNVSLRIACDWKSALIGRNGRGKTTLLKLINGDVRPQSGDLSVPTATVEFPYFCEDDTLTCLEVMKDAVAPYRHWETQMELALCRGDERSLHEYAEIQT